LSIEKNKNDIAIATMKKSAMDLLSIIINGINDQIIIKILSGNDLDFNENKYSFEIFVIFKLSKLKPKNK
tara:strand:- start:332 stop:541 length:210 start_codon:yes stop_codon:yes gene_type:complete